MAHFLASKGSFEAFCAEHMAPGTPLCVDLDGTLTLWDTAYLLWKSLSWKQRWAYRSYWHQSPEGKVLLKAQLFDQGTLGPFSQWCRSLLVQELARLKDHYPLYLATGAWQGVGNKVQQETQLFQEVFASHVDKLSQHPVHLTGATKGQFLKNRFPQGFFYLGNSFQDLDVWKEALGGALVGGSHRLWQTMQNRFSYKPLFQWS